MLFCEFCTLVQEAQVSSFSCMLVLHDSLLAGIGAWWTIHGKGIKEENKLIMTPLILRVTLYIIRLISCDLMMNMAGLQLLRMT